MPASAATVGRRHDVRLVIELDLPGHQDLGAGAPTRAAEDHSDAGDQLLHAERLGEVVVAADGQATQAVLDRIAGGEEHDRDLVAGRPQPPADLEAVNVGQHHVEHNQITRCAGTGQVVERFPPSCHLADGEPGQPQGGRGNVADVVFVLDNQHRWAAHAVQRTVRTWRLPADTFKKCWICPQCPNDASAKVGPEERRRLPRGWG
jgi:hypothetical protein